MPQIDWGVALTNAIGNIPTAVVTAGAIFWINHLSKKLADGLEKNGNKKIFGHRQDE